MKYSLEIAQFGVSSGTKNWLQTPAPPASVAEILGKSTFSFFIFFKFVFDVDHF